MEVAIITAVDSILFEARSRQKQIVALIREMVECESPSDDPAAVNRFVDLLGDVAPSFARVKTVPGGRFGRHVVCEFDLFGKKKQGQILALGHSDTVWPLGTLAQMPVQLPDARNAPLVSILGGEYIFEAGGTDAATDLTTNLYDLIAYTPLDSPPAERGDFAGLHYYPRC